MLLLVPLLYGVLRKMVYHECHIANYISSVGVANIIVGVCCLCAALVWAAVNNYWWGMDTKIAFKGALLVSSDPYTSACLVKCGLQESLRPDSCNSTACLQDWSHSAASPSAERDPAKPCLLSAGKLAPDGKWLEDPQYNLDNCQSVKCQMQQIRDPTFHCLAAFLLYSAQFIAAFATIGFGVVAVLLGRSVRSTAHSPGKINPVIKIFMTIFLVGLVCIWSAASIAGASMRLSNMVMAFALLCMVVAVVLMGTVIGWSDLKSQMSQVRHTTQLATARMPPPHCSSCRGHGLRTSHRGWGCATDSACELAREYEEVGLRESLHDSRRGADHPRILCRLGGESIRAQVVPLHQDPEDGAEHRGYGG